MKYNPERKTIGQILSLTNPPVVVPDWQRNFSWTSQETETFWQDLLKFDEQYPDDNIDGQEYFLGAVVIVDSNNLHLLLDGQQRIATAAILLSVIREFLARYNQNAGTRVSTRYLTDYDDALEDYTYKMTLNRFDKDFFKREILEVRPAEWSPPEAKYDSHRLIRDARAYFVGKFDELYNSTNEPKEAHDWTLRILKVLTNHVSVVAVISTDEDNASSVFETLNDRGIGLSTTDLLRSLILRRANTDHLDEILNLWGETLEIEAEAKLQDFIRHFWIAREGDVKTRSLYREVKSQVMEQDIDSLQFSREISDSSRVYREILAASFSGDREIEGLLDDISMLGAKVLYPPCLSLFESTLDISTIKTHLKSFICAFVRHTLICKKENSNFESLIFDIAKRIRSADLSTREFTDEIAAFSPDDITFQSAFESVSIGRMNSSRYLLKEIELSKRPTEELLVAFPDRVHVEHIYPKTPLPSERNPNHEFLINMLGNHTLLSARLNTSLRNAAFSDKKPKYAESDLIITQEIAANYSDWGQLSIRQRQSDLAESAVEIWKFQ